MLLGNINSAVVQFVFICYNVGNVESITMGFSRDVFATYLLRKN